MVCQRDRAVTECDYDCPWLESRQSGSKAAYDLLSYRESIQRHSQSVSHFILPKSV